MDLTHSTILIVHLLGLAVLLGVPLAALAPGGPPDADSAHALPRALPRALRRLLVGAAVAQLTTGLALTALLEVDGADVSHVKIAVKLALMITAGVLAVSLARRPEGPRRRLGAVSVLAAATTVVAVLV